MGSHRIPRPSPAMVVACTALLVALGGTGYAAITLPRNSVGPGQIRIGAVSNTKLAKAAVTGAKVARNSLTGVQVNESTLGIVPSASHATSADTAKTATSIAASEAFHVVGANGEPAFQNSWEDKGGTLDKPAGFYKDRAGIVHLRGRIFNGSANTVIFQLPAGYRPEAGKFISFPADCECMIGQSTSVSIAGSGLGATVDGSLRVDNGTLQSGGTLHLDGISFLAES